jgi:hypothetical protein
VQGRAALQTALHWAAIALGWQRKSRRRRPENTNKIESGKDQVTAVRSKSEQRKSRDLDIIDVSKNAAQGPI